jgi:pimeloyl-ACP methyl ester carboxylesterase
MLLRRVALLLAALLLIAVTPAAAQAHRGSSAIDWAACGDDAPGWECATVRVPFDWDKKGKQPAFDLAVTRLPASGDASEYRGPLFVNFGGPGAGANDALHGFGADLFGGVTERYDLIGLDPRGTGGTVPSIDCKVDQEFDGLYSKPFWTPENLDPRTWISKSHALADSCVANNGAVLKHVNSADVARDMDYIRGLLGVRKLNYYGFSYGTYLGATYATLFPRRYRSMVLDGALNPDQYANDPTAGLRVQSQGFEVALGRFFQACAAQQDACGFGGADPWSAFDELHDSLNANPQPTSDGRFVDGDDMLVGIVFVTMYAKQNWSFAAFALHEAATGNYDVLRFLADLAFGRLDDGTTDPGTDRYFTIGAADQDYSHRSIASFRREGERSFELFPHTYFNVGYVELPYSFLSSNKDRFSGPFRLPPDAKRVLVVGTTYDPATPYVGAKAMVRQLREARLLTMRGDGHTAYGGNSACIDEAVNTFLNEGDLPAPGTTCRQEVDAFPPATQRAASAGRLVWRPGARVMP